MPFVANSFPKGSQFKDFGRCWRVLGPLGGLGPSWVDLGRILGPLGGILEGIGPSWAELWWILRTLGEVLEDHVVGRVGTCWDVL